MKKQFYFIKVQGLWIGIDKQPTEDFSKANLYQGDPNSLIQKLTKSGLVSEDDIELFELEVNESSLLSMKIAQYREEQIKSILE
jgi:hypothetical protein